LAEDKVRMSLNRLENLNWEINRLEKRIVGLVNLKLHILDELRCFGLKDSSDLKSYLDENPNATPIRELARRKADSA